MEYGNGEKNQLVWKSTDNKYHNEHFDADENNINVNVSMLSKYVSKEDIEYLSNKSIFSNVPFPLNGTPTINLLSSKDNTGDRIMVSDLLTVMDPVDISYDVVFAYHGFLLSIHGIKYYSDSNTLVFIYEKINI